MTDEAARSEDAIVSRCLLAAVVIRLFNGGGSLRKGGRAGHRGGKRANAEYERCGSDQAEDGLPKSRHLPSILHMMAVGQFNGQRPVAMPSGGQRTVRFRPMPLKKSESEGSRGSAGVEARWLCRSGRHRLRRDRDHVGELAEVLGRGSEVEFVTGAIWPT